MICTSCSGTGGFLHCTNPECDCAPETCGRCDGFGGFCDECGKPSDASPCPPCTEQEARDEEANREYLNREYLRSQEGDWMRRPE